MIDLLGQRGSEECQCCGWYRISNQSEGLQTKSFWSTTSGREPIRRASGDADGVAICGVSSPDMDFVVCGAWPGELCGLRRDPSLMKEDEMIFIILSGNGRR